ncbi:hypothetical protein HUA74_30200 [Myxococcus sp. CA051A]|uniref:hypothetical protein n=1 Tax=unclassified Myxococcus TaxID=2648731 RepID=UPI00157B8F6D|nr:MULTISPECIES: hypothetical protein [unclassified Myxococcus]NTX54198.1 hypothetical protein [Myxococcus sp. CA039A]NTX64934.1 hypothetical protein [Myxococcus sp. CA051A]
MALPWENGALRGTRVRCPGCTRFNTPGIRCPSCACGPVPPEHYGAARMLLHAGVDRFSVVGRLEALEPSLSWQLESQYAARWADVLRVVADVRECQPFLTLPDFAEDAEDRWAEQLPWTQPPIPESSSDEDDEDFLAAMFQRSQAPEVRQLAALAKVQLRQDTRDMFSTVLSCLYQEGRAAMEAALALTRWRVWSRTRLQRQQREFIERHARDIFAGFPEHTARAAVAWVRATGKPPEVDLLFALREGLRSPDEDLRFECALVLQDEPGLLAALDSEDAEVVTEARGALASLGSSALLERLRETGDAAFVRDVLRRLPSPPTLEVLDAVLAVSAREPDALADAVQSWARNMPFERLSPEVQARWGAWARDTLGTWPARNVMRWLEWATEEREARATPAARAFHDAAVRALRVAPSSERAELVRAGAFTSLLALGDVEELTLVHSWARDAACAKELLDLLVSLPGRLDRLAPELGRGRSARLLMAAWERPARAAVLAPLAKAVRSWSGISGREELIDAVWLRFQCHPSERAELLAAFTPWRQELWERQLAAEPDAIATFETWWRADSQLQLPGLVGWLLGDVSAQTLAERLPFVWAAAEARVDAWPRSTSHAVSSASAPLNNALRQGHDFLIPDVERFMAWLPDFERRVREAPVAEAESSYHRDLLEDIHVDVKMMGEYLERRRDEEERRRQDELRRRVEESRRRDQQRQMELAQLEADRIRQEQEAHRARLMSAVAQMGTPMSPERWFQSSPRVDAQDLDTEVILPGATLGTLLEYARVLKAMSVCGNSLEVFEARGLSIADWSTEAQAWIQAMMRRPELSVRFAQLLTAPWN